MKASEKFTRAPPRYNQLSLLRKMEEEGIGTKATRSEIIEILYRRRYVDEARMAPSTLAVAVVSLLDKYCSQIVDAALTRDVEVSMAKVQESETSRKLILLERVNDLRNVMMSLVEYQSEIGNTLGEIINARRQVDISFKLPCPNCGSFLTIVRNKKTGKRFVGCKGKWEKNCDFRLPLPQMGSLKILNRPCEKCGFELVQARTGRRMLISCPRCYSTDIKRGANARTRLIGVEVRS